MNATSPFLSLPRGALLGLFRAVLRGAALQLKAWKPENATNFKVSGPEWLCEVLPGAIVNEKSYTKSDIDRCFRGACRNSEEAQGLARRRLRRRGFRHGADGYLGPGVKT